MLHTSAQKFHTFLGWPKYFDCAEGSGRLVYRRSEKKTLHMYEHLRGEIFNQYLWDSVNIPISYGSIKSIIIEILL